MISWPAVPRTQLLRGQRRFESAAMTHRARLRAQLIAALDDLDGFWLPFDVAESEAYASVRARNESTVRSKDAFIAAHAAANGVPLITGDKGFTRFENVQVVVV